MDKMYIGTKRCIHCNGIMQLGKDVTCERCIEILRKDKHDNCPYHDCKECVGE